MFYFLCRLEFLDFATAYFKAFVKILYKNKTKFSFVSLGKKLTEKLYC